MSYIYFVIAFILSPAPSAFFSSSETAIANTTAPSGSVEELKEDEQGTLLTILLGNHWSNQLPTMILSAWSVDLFGVWFWVPMGLHTFYTLYMGEMLPKAYALIKANVIAKMNAPFLLPLVKLCGPTLTKIAPKHEKTQDELCLEARLQAEMQSEIKTLKFVLEKFPNAKPLCPSSTFIMMDETVKIADAEEHCMKEIMKKENPWAHVDTTWIQIVSSNKMGPRKTLGHISLSMMYLLDWKHIK